MAQIENLNSWIQDFACLSRDAIRHHSILVQILADAFNTQPDSLDDIRTANVLGATNLMLTIKTADDINVLHINDLKSAHYFLGVLETVLEGRVKSAFKNLGLADEFFDRVYDEISETESDAIDDFLEGDLKAWHPITWERYAVAVFRRFSRLSDHAKTSAKCLLSSREKYIIATKDEEVARLKSELGRAIAGKKKLRGSRGVA